MTYLIERPGLLFVIATLLPLAGATILLLANGLRSLARANRDHPWFAAIERITGGDRPGRFGAYFAVTVMTLTCLVGLAGAVLVLSPSTYLQLAQSAGIETLTDEASRYQGRLTWLEIKLPPAGDRQPGATFDPQAPPRPGSRLELGYAIDHLTALVFAMVVVVALLIFVYTLGYLAEEANPQVADHTLTNPDGTPLHRPGRLNSFYLYLLLFTFSMLNLLIADNLFQIFISWELVGICSFLLIGYYFERPAASVAANKAFIVNRIGDAGFLVAIAILWVYCGTLNLQELSARLRSPAVDSHQTKLELAGQFVRVDLVGRSPEERTTTYRLPERGEPPGTHVALFPPGWTLEPDKGHFHGLGYPVAGGGRHQPEREFEVYDDADMNSYGAMPYWLLVVAGLGVFLGAVGKSAQFPLHVWLPDAMEGPTPVSALIHAATMVAAGVYLVGRAYPLFTAEVLLVIAYTGAITAFLAATIALVMRDIKRVPAYSTISQLGLMMLALGVGGWQAGLLHLLTHAFFKALLFLAAGSVIHALHHEQDIFRMGGLRHRMPITAWTMLVGVLAISGMVLFSGWYSKDQIFAATLGFVQVQSAHWLLFGLLLLTTGLTSFYMFRLWFLVFCGQPRDAELVAHAHESPRVMTVPLILLAIASVVVAWDFTDWRLLDPEASTLGKLLHEAEPPSVSQDFSHEHHAAHQAHSLAGGLALAAAVLGGLLAAAIYLFGWIDRRSLGELLNAESEFLANRWYIDSLYDRLFTRPTVALAKWIARRDKPATDREGVDLGTVDGVVAAPARSLYLAGLRLRAVQSGQIRYYVLLLVLTALGLYAILTLAGRA
jgi:NADH-quinone oxidoreductase subunit L